MKISMEKVKKFTDSRKFIYSVRGIGWFVILLWWIDVIFFKNKYYEKYFGMLGFTAIIATMMSMYKVELKNMSWGKCLVSFVVYVAMYGVFAFIFLRQRGLLPIF